VNSRISVYFIGITAISTSGSCSLLVVRKPVREVSFETLTPALSCVCFQVVKKKLGIDSKHLFLRLDDSLKREAG
jgi:hypothetical protein